MELGEVDLVNFDDAVAREEFISEMRAETDAFFKLRTLATAFSPVSPGFESPYQDYIEVYREFKNIDPEHADELFLEAFGQEYFALTQAFTKNNSGIPPTVEGMRIAGEHEDLITRYPELSRVIVGADAGGTAIKFSRFAYDRQLRTPLREGSGILERERLTPRRDNSGSRRTVGWIKFSRAMDSIDALMADRGLTNLRVKEAADLATLKRTHVDLIGQQHPEWLADYLSVDKLKWERRLVGLDDISSSIDRDDLNPVQTYMSLRETMIAMLTIRDSRDITSESNHDLSLLWERLVNALVQSNTAFADLYHRYLENDPLNVSLGSAKHKLNVDDVPNEIADVLSEAAA